MTRSRRIAFTVLVAAAAVTAAVFVIIRPKIPPNTTASNVPTGPDPLEVLFPPGYGEEVQKITRLLESSPTSRPSAADADELLHEAASDPDFRIRVRAMAVLPFLQQRERAIDILIKATTERDPEASGGGNVPLYATTYLADMKATRAIPAVADWVAFLQAKHPYSTQVGAMIEKKSGEDLQRLRAAATRPAS